MYYVGLDVHSRQSSIEVLDDNGKLFRRQLVKGPWSEVVRVISELPKPLTIGYEASCGYGTIHDRLSRHAQRIIVGHPGQMRLIFRSKRKNDRVDAQKIAKLVYLDAMPQVHVPSVDIRQWRRMIEFRQRLVGKCSAMKNQLRAILKTLGIKAPPNLWCQSGYQWLRDQTEITGAYAVERDILLEDLTSQSQQIKRVEKELLVIAQKHPGVSLLMTIPGVGPRTAEAVVAYLDDVKRFGNSRQVGSYFGLVPTQDASADKNRLGHITREGPPTVRKLLGEASWQGIKHSPTIQGWFDRISKNDPDRKKIAIVSVARKLCVVMSAMLRTGEAWREDLRLLKELKKEV